MDGSQCPDVVTYDSRIRVEYSLDQAGSFLVGLSVLEEYYVSCADYVSQVLDDVSSDWPEPGYEHLTAEEFILGVCQIDKMVIDSN